MQGATANTNINSTLSADANINAEVSSAAAADANSMRIICGCGSIYIILTWNTWTSFEAVKPLLRGRVEDSTVVVH